uniref:B30.2/SPRY domain-containing protein n=1 Tax=Salarias fasciatus TaxID=181472 RepID=A0A672JB04_SALFA
TVRRKYSGSFSRLSGSTSSFPPSSVHAPQQKSKSLRFPAKTVEIPNTEELPYVMYKSLRGALTDLKNSLKETFHQAVTTLSEAQPYPDHPDRFGSWAQVLCRAGMAGRCYWEVEWEGRVSICVCYKSMSRKGRGDDSKMGHNAKSWSLDCSDTLCTFHHDRHSVRVPAACWRRIGVFLDFRAGTLSFYNVSDPMLQLHKVQTSFSQPLYPGFWVGLGLQYHFVPQGGVLS